MDYSELCDIFEELENTSRSLEKTTILARFLQKIKERPEYIYFLQGRVFSDYDARELGLSIQLVIRSIAKASGLSDSAILESFKNYGDLGIVAENVLGEKKKQQSLFNQKLTIEKVFQNLRKITTFEGKGTVESKISLVIELLHFATPKEAKYITRTVLGDLKIGIGNGIIRDSIVEYCFKPKDIAEKKIFVDEVQDAYNKATDFAVVFKKACENKLREIVLTPGKPVKVMLYPKAKDAKDALRIVGSPAAFEYKYDGFRVMINKDLRGDIRIFTRRLEEVSSQFIDVVKFVRDNVKGKNFIIDGEVVGYDPKTKKYKEFQAISQRIKRKYEIDKLIRKIPVELRLFDIIYYEGKSLIEKDYLSRRKLLKLIVKEKKWKIKLAKQIVTGNIKKAQQFFAAALDEGQEGLMVKGLDKGYKPGSRVGYGVKWKPEDNDFDLVITGAEWGTGKRAGWLTSFEVSCNDNSQLKEIGKVSTGLKEKKEEGVSYSEMTKILKPLIISESGRKVKVKPKIVISVQYQNIQKSPTYSSGYAMRFPRFLKLRPDRGKDDIAQIKEIRDSV